MSEMRIDIGNICRLQTVFSTLTSLSLILIFTCCGTANNLYINEIYIDPGGSGEDEVDEYIELRGTPSMRLDNHYLIFIENEDTPQKDGEAGEIDNIFDLHGVALGTNGFLTLRQKNSPYSVATGATDLVNDGPNNSAGPFANIPPGYGSGANSTIGASDQPTEGNPYAEGKVENGGFTAMLIHNISGSPPVLGTDLDVGNDGLDIPTGQNGWDILDSVGVHGEEGEATFGVLYAQVNFSPDEVANPNIPDDAEFNVTGFEIEYVGRWGNSTGQTNDDWHVSNLTDDSGAGSTGKPDWRQSFSGAHPPSDGDPTTPAPAQSLASLESNKNVPYGTKMTTTLGAANFMLGDYNLDGEVSAADYTVWFDNQGQTGTEESHPAADGNHDFLVDQRDYLVFRGNFSGPSTDGLLGAGQTASATTLPEPAGWLLLLAAGSLLLHHRKFGK